MNALANTLHPVSGAARPLVRIVIAGHVDHGKSTLIGRLLHETGSLPDGKLDTLKAVSARRGMAFEWSFLVDALQTERNQGITIDTSQIRFRSPTRDFVLIDAPGHTEFLRNMITGATQADAAILIVDATEGVRNQTRRHGYLLHLLGVRQVALVINKMDRIGYDAAKFYAIGSELAAFLSNFGLTAAATIPISARNGDGVARRTEALSWYEGPTLLQALDRFSPARSAPDLALRLPVQAVYKFDDRRIVAGRLESGRLSVGDEIVVAPGGQRARVKSIEAWSSGRAGAPHEALAGQSVGITLDREILVERGYVVCDATALARSSDRLTARIFWLHQAPLEVGARVNVRIGTAEAAGIVAAIKNAVDPGDLAPTHGQTLPQNHVADVAISLSRPLAHDPYTANPAVARVVLELSGRIFGGGQILPDAGGVAAVPRAADSGGSALLEVQADGLAEALAPLPLGERLAHLRRSVVGRIVFTTSFGLEDQVILHELRTRNIDIDVVTLDTGRLFPETYELWAETERRYGCRIAAFYPRHDQLEALIARQGINGFYQSQEARRACCHVRKVEPLDRALAGARAWVTGLRSDQSVHRSGFGIATVDGERRLIKVNPLFDWSREDVLAFAASHAVPINPLHAKGFVSIGCAPCTRAIAPGEDERAGRWWWENDTKKECGLHSKR
jgi:sulfate adenylyltransferase large subunit/thioredoxin-dependent adenylylsulfate APS reductase